MDSIKGNSYEVVFNGEDTIEISGKLSASPEEYEKIEEFFEEVLKSLGKKEIILDIRNLVYLNSSGIKSICVSLIMEADDMEDLKMKVLCSGAYTWQKETVPSFQGLMEEKLEIIFE